MHLQDVVETRPAAGRRPGPWAARWAAAACAALLALGAAGCTSAAPPAAAPTVAAAEPTAPAPDPSPTATAASALAGATVVDSFGNPDFYTTVDGDTLSAVAAAFGFSETKLAEFNALTPGAPLSPDTRLRLLPEGPVIGASGPAVVSADGIPTSYTVQLDDTLTGVTYRFNVSQDQLAEANKVHFVHEQGNVHFLVEGRTIQLQKNPVDSRAGGGTAVMNSWDRGVFYTTVDGDSIDSVGYQFRVGTAELLQYNPTLAENQPIAAGTRLRLIPGETPIDGARGTFTADDDGVALTYTTAPGDTEAGIAERFGVTTLAEANRPSSGPRGVWYRYAGEQTDAVAPGQTISVALDQPINNPGTW
ncbi:membrane-bound lytic murein transglycosylase D [Arthrobacter saudimassiliensis]|uniref:Membrane-bound lytic murein transglycosylase D n=1 Tax=Arthrobacter saudimassiliensis TaxID=1461584 RepID=A0A078MX46_9MICC|nr:membrane-bound lytic murein transglycosylase D [Arthrobacter saudimassiliensis]